MARVGPSATLKIPAGAVVQDLVGKYIYPGLVDIFTSYGMPEVKAPERRGPAVRLAEGRRLRLEPGYSPRGERR